MTKPTSYSRGVAAEQTAKAYLQQLGYEILAERYRNAGGEIDIVTCKDDTLVFVEVKARAALEDGLYAITERQQKRIARAAEGFLAQHPGYSSYNMRFDAVIITPSGLPNHLEHAFICT